MAEAVIGHVVRMYKLRSDILHGNTSYEPGVQREYDEGHDVIRSGWYARDAIVWTVRLLARIENFQRARNRSELAVFKKDHLRDALEAEHLRSRIHEFDVERLLGYGTK